MRVTYEWTEREWDQAVTVATRKASRGTPMPGMIYALIGIPLLGAVGDLASLVRSSGRITIAGSIMPMLLVLFALTAALLIGLSQRRRRRQREGVAPMPIGPREMVLQEAGWRFSEGPQEAMLPQIEASETAEAAGLDPVLGPVLAVESLSADAPLPDEEDLAIAAQGKAPLAVPQPAVPLRPWSDLLEARQGSGVIVLVHRDGFDAVPAKALTPEQAGHLHRLVMRKMRPPA